MAKPRNLRIYNTDQVRLAELRSEYISLGFDTELERGILTVFTRKRKPKRVKAVKGERNKRAESAGRRQSSS
jgi:hypothetical protein